MIVRFFLHVTTPYKIEQRAFFLDNRGPLELWEGPEGEVFEKTVNTKYGADQARHYIVTLSDERAQDENFQDGLRKLYLTESV